MPHITVQQARRWALFGRTPNEWAIENVVGRPERFVVGTTGRQVGKTDELADRIDMAMNAEPREEDKTPDKPPYVGILGPNYEKALISVERYIENLTRVFGHDSYRLNQNKHELVIRDPLAGKPGATLKWLSAEEEFNVVGHTFSDFGVDEAQAIPDNVWNKFIPTQDVRDAHGWVFGTPDVTVDQTWFQGLWESGQDPLDLTTHSFTVASWDAPWMNMANILYAKQHMPINDFRRLYGGEWVETAGLVFTGYELAMLGFVPAYEPFRRYVMAVDLAIQNDFNVVMIGDPMTRVVIHYERWNLTDPLETYDRIRDIHERFGRPKVWVDATGMGRIPARELRGHLGNTLVVPVEWSSGDKATYNKMDAVRALAGDLQHRRTMFPAAWDDLRREMKSFVYGRSPTGRLTAGARTNAHDDLVMTLVMINLAFRSRSGGEYTASNYLTNSEPEWARGLFDGMFD